MASRFYYDLTNGDSIFRDEEGVEVADLDQALQQACTVIKNMRESGELADIDDGWQMIIRGADGTVFGTVPVR